MKIAQIVTNWTQFHAEDAIGIKAVVRDVTRGLVKRGHEVTVFAPDGSTFDGATLHFMGPSLKDCGHSLFDPESVSLQQEYAKKIIPHLSGFDVVHSHIEHVLLPFLDEISVPVVSTVHGAGFRNAEVEVFKTYPKGIFVGLSRRATEVLSYIHFFDVVYNGIDVDKCPFFLKIQPPGYLSWMGRFSKNKGALDAIEAATEMGKVLTLVGFEQNSEEEYFKEIESKVDGAMIRLVDKMIGKMKYDFLGNAEAFLFPIHWEEPFGLVMVEAMACGTPVVAYNRGSVSEIVQDGLTGFVIDSDSKDGIGKGTFKIKKKGVEGLVEAIARIEEIDRSVCRKHVEENFTADKMVENYEKIYKKVINQK